MVVTKEELIQELKAQITATDFEVKLIIERSIRACQLYVNNPNYDVLKEASCEVVALALYLWDSMSAKASVEKGIASISQSSRSVSFLNSKELEAQIKEYIQNSLSLPRYAKVW